VGDESVLVPLSAQVVDTNGLVVLNVTGRCVWEMLKDERSVQDLAAGVAERFDVPLDQALADVTVFLDEIGRMGLLEKSE